ncbi:chemotaxis protein CheA [Azotobacter armeniacus]
MDITDFYDTFFEEAAELLEDMERHLLELDIEAPDPEQLNAIFRAAHSIKGGAGTFGFDVLQRTTHIFENILDHLRRGELKLRRDIVDTFLETKDMLQDQLAAYRNGSEPDPEAFARICQTLQQMAMDELGKQGAEVAIQAPTPAPAAEPAPPPVPDTAKDPAGEEGSKRLSVVLLGVAEKDRELLIEELRHFGSILGQAGDARRYEVELATGESADDIEAVLCFVVEPEQLEIHAFAAAPQVAVQEEGTEPEPGEPVPPAGEKQAPATVVAVPAPGAAASQPCPAAPGKAPASNESTTLRVPVTKVDQIINLVGELVITQSMLDQMLGRLDGAMHSELVNGIALLQRNARDLQEAVMSIRMVPMDFVFSRFPRQVHDLAAKLGKEVELVTVGKSTELDKSLVERIVDPLNHLVRNSLDHGLESPEVREAAGKPRTGRLTLSAQHQGGNILIDVSDDGAGLNRDRLLAKARSNGLPVSDGMSDDEVWQLIFAPGFSTAEVVSDVSGRGVGMDVVRRNIQSLGGHVQILSRQGQGTTTRIVLPLTLAILDGMSIRAGEEIFILPLNAVIESLQPRSEDIYAMAGADQLLKVRDEYLPLLPLHRVFGIPRARTRPSECIAVIVQGEGTRCALLVDELVGQQQVVVKNLETNYRKVPGVSAATILGDGSVSLILDIADLQRLNRRQGAVRQERTAATDEQEPMLS